MLRRAVYIVTFLLLMLVNTVWAQCPVNMGFDLGSFQGWEGYTGTIHDPDGTITFSSQGIVDGIHSLISRKSKQIDFYAKFPITSPNGSNYVAMLGNDSHGGGQNKAQKLTYTFTVPQNNNNFSLIYYYAVVIEDPPADNRHTNLNKPKFTAAVYNVTDNKPTDCANFNFVSISSLPGFGAAPTQSANKDVYYKAWSPVTIDLRGYAGKTMRLEFTTNNCAPGGHFAYAYIDVNQNCTSPVAGNIICSGNNTMTLKAPSGFKAYAWYNGRNFNQVIGTDSTYKITPLPAVGTQYSVVISPYDGLGCQDTITTTVQSAENLALNVKNNLAICRSSPADITAQDITAGSDPSFVYTYYKDAAATVLIDDPTNIVDAGTYYIKATPPSECSFIKPITVSFLPTPTLKITNPPEVCQPLTVDITKAYITAGSILFGSPLNYYNDVACEQPLNNPDKISKSGTYYIKVINTANGCANVQPVTVLIDDLPVLKITDMLACETADITTPASTYGSLNTSRYTYWLNAQCTDTLRHPKAITVPGLYYIRAYSAAGCYVSSPINVSILPYPKTTVIDPPSVIFPQTIDITHTYTPEVGTQFAFYMDSLGKRLVPDPAKISVKGTYYIQAVNINGCAKMFAVHVNVLPPVVVDYGINTFTPNGDGNNDVFRLKLTKSVRLDHFRVFNSWGALLFETTDYLKGWDGSSNGKKMPVGTYYWILDGYDLYLNKPIQQSGSVTIVL